VGWDQLQEGWCFGFYMEPVDEIFARPETQVPYTVKRLDLKVAFGVWCQSL